MSAELLNNVQEILERGGASIEIDLSNDGLNDKDIINLVGLLKKYSSKEIAYLKLYRNDISNVGAKSLAILSNVSSINLSDNRISDEGAKALSANPCITQLDLTDNPITDNCREFIVENAKQTYLALERTKMSKETLSKIKEVISRNGLKLKYLEGDKKSLSNSQEMGVIGVFKSPDLRPPRSTGKEGKHASSQEVSSEDSSPRVNIVEHQEKDGKTTFKVELVVEFEGKKDPVEMKNEIRLLIEGKYPAPKQGKSHNLASK